MSNGLKILMILCTTLGGDAGPTSASNGAEEVANASGAAAHAAGAALARELWGRASRALANVELVAVPDPERAMGFRVVLRAAASGVTQERSSEEPQEVPEAPAEASDGVRTSSAGAPESTTPREGGAALPAPVAKPAAGVEGVAPKPGTSPVGDSTSNTAAETVRDAQSETTPKPDPLVLGEEEILPGIVQPARDVQMAFPLDGILRKIEVSAGDSVEPNQPLAALDCRVPEAAVAAAEAEVRKKAGLESAQHDIDLAQSYLTRLQKSGARGATTEASIDEARTRLKKARTVHAAELERRDQAELNLKLEQARLAQHRLKAPFAARVTQVIAEEGAAVGSRDPVLRLVCLELLEVELHLPSRVYGRLKLGREVSLHSSLGGVLKGKLRHVDPIIDAAMDTFRCVFEIANPGEKLPAGFAVTLRRL